MQHTSYNNGNGSATAATVIAGRGIPHLQCNKRQRAVLAAEILDGRTILQPCIKQLSQLLGVNEEYIRLARTFSPQKREAVLGGWDTPLSSLPIERRPLLNSRII
jgi:hypothetical protein